MSATLIEAGLKRARSQNHSQCQTSAPEGDSSKRAKPSSPGLPLLLQQQQQQQSFQDGYQYKQSMLRSDGHNTANTHKLSAAKLKGSTTKQHYVAPTPASINLQQMYQPFLRQVAAGIAAGLAANTAVNRGPCSPEVAVGDSGCMKAASHDGCASLASCSSAAELLLPQLASQGIDLTAFLQPMVQMVASLSAGDSSSSSAAGGAAGRTSTTLAGMTPSLRAVAGGTHAAADAAAAWLVQQGSGTVPGAARQHRGVAKSRVPLFSEAQLAAQEQLATATADWFAAAAGTAGRDSRRTAAPASTAGVGAAAVQDAAAYWDQARAVQRQSSSTLTAVLARAMTEQEAAVLSNHHQQQGEAQQQQVQQAAVSASPDMQTQQQQLAQMQLQQGSWMSSSSSSAASSSAAGGAALGSLMSPTASITGQMLSPAAASAHKQQQAAACAPLQASQHSRQWQCSSNAVPSYTAAAEPGSAAAAGTAGVNGSGAHTVSGREHFQHHAQRTAARAAGLARSQAAQAGAVAVKGAVQCGLRAERAAPGPADSRVINQHRQHILTLEQSLGNMHPQVGRAYLALSALLYREGSTWSLSMAHRAQQRAAHIMQGMQQAAATASFRAAQAQPAACGSGYGHVAAKGIVASCDGYMQQEVAAALAAVADLPMTADAVVRVVARRAAAGGLVKQPKVV